MQKRNYAAFMLMSVFSAIEVVSGFVLWLILPRGGEGFRGGRGLVTPQAEFLSLERSQWLNLHDWVGIALIVVVVVHLVLHRKWIVCMTKKLLRLPRSKSPSIVLHSESGDEKLLPSTD